MSWTALIWLYIAASIAISALLAFSPQLNAARLALRSRLRSWTWMFRHDRRGTPWMLIVPAVVFLLVAGIGAAASYYVRDTPTGIGSRSHSEPSHEALARLKDYTRSIGTEKPASMPAPGKPLPDVNTMIERLAARLETTPGDMKGWRMLGWSYFHTGRYKQAATALARAVELDPNSTELKLAYEDAKAKASLQTEAVDKGGDGLGVEKIAKSEVMPPHGQDDATVRSTVDGLAKRLESSPRDVEGWTRLMRSRVVLGDREVAATAFRKALEVFKDDSAASGKIAAAAIELGLTGK